MKQLTSVDLVIALSGQQSHFTPNSFLPSKAALEEPGQEQFSCAQPQKTKTMGWLHGCTTSAVAQGLMLRRASPLV